MLLTDQPGTVTSGQLRRLHGVGRRLGLVHADLREACNVNSLTELSRRSASAHIERLGGSPLRHAPGTKPRPRRRKAPGNIRLLRDYHRNQIEALRQELAWTHGALAGWLDRCFKTESVDGLRTAERAGRAIYALTCIRDRRRDQSPEPAARPAAAEVPF